MQFKGQMVQWGMTAFCDDESINEVQQNDIEDIVSVEPSEPFLQQPSNKVLMSQVLCGFNFCASVSVFGQIYTWGNNNFGQLGHNDRQFRIFPTQIKHDSFFTSIKGQYYHIVALSDKGQVYSWGKRQAVGGKAIQDRFGRVNDFENQGIDQLTPRQLKEVLDYYKIIQIDAGLNHNACITEQGYLYLWGDNYNGQLGIMNQNKDEQLNSTTIPKKNTFFEQNKHRVLNVSCGGSHTLAITIDENNNYHLYSWGNGEDGQCGHGDKGNRMIPTKISFFELNKNAQISAGYNHSLVLTDELYGFGKSKNGVLGDFNELVNIYVPKLIKLDSSEKILKLQTSKNFSSVIISIN